MFGDLIFIAIVNALVQKDYHLSCRIKNVAPVSDVIAEQIKEYIEDYGEELIDLPKETWDTSTYLYFGNHWNVLIDLFTRSGGLSDLVLKAEIKEINNDYLVSILLVYVP